MERKLMLHILWHNQTNENTRGVVGSRRACGETWIQATEILCKYSPCMSLDRYFEDIHDKSLIHARYPSVHARESQNEMYRHFHIAFCEMVSSENQYLASNMMVFGCQFLILVFDFIFMFYFFLRNGYVSIIRVLHGCQGSQ